LEKAAAEGVPVTGRVVNKIKGGLEVDIGVMAFLPSSQVEVRPIHNLDGYVGRDIEVRILKLNGRRGNAVVSRRVLLEHEAVTKKTEEPDRLWRLRGLRRN
jgi:small subunit ribosomal protein S1